MTALGRIVLTLAGGGSIAIAFFACWVSGGDFLLLVGDAVVPSPVVAVSVWSVAVLSGIGLAGLTLLQYRQRHIGRGGRLAMAFVGGLLAVALVGTGVWCTATALTATGVRALGPHAYTVLRASGGQGCTLIADETGMLRSSNGRLYALDQVGFARPVAAWQANEIQLPVRDGDYSLHWANAVGSLSFRTSRFIDPDRLRLTCNE